MIRRATVLCCSFLLLFVIAGCQQTLTIDSDQVLDTEIKNISNPTANVFASGQPSKEQLNTLSELGVKHVINLRPATEQDWDEEAYVVSLGMTYHNIPVEGAAGITAENAGALSGKLEALKGEAILLHCSSGNRVGALVALQNGLATQDADAAIAVGKQWGLTRLEAKVRALLTE